MTVFGFGRKRLSKFIELVPAHFTVGLCEGSTFAELSKVVNSAYNPLVIAVGNPQVIGRQENDQTIS